VQTSVSRRHSWSRKGGICYPKQ